MPTSSKSKARKAETIAVDNVSKSGESFRKSKTIAAASNVEDNCDMRESKDTTPADEEYPKQTEMVSTAERASSSQEIENMVNSRRYSITKGKKRTTNRESGKGERKTRKKAIAERDGPHKHSKSARNKRKILLKQKLRQRRRVSEARLKSYGLTL